MLRRQRGREGRQDGVAGRHRRVDPQVASQLPVARFHPQPQIVPAVQALQREGQEGLTLLGQLHPSGVPLEEPHLELILQPAEQAAQSRGARVHRRRRPGEMQVPGQGDEGFKFVEVHRARIAFN